MTPPRSRGPFDGLVDLIADRERQITRLLFLLIASQLALAACAWSHGDRTLTGIAVLVAALVAVRLWRHLAS